MIRFLGFCTILFLLYLSFIFLGQLDSRVLITVYDDYIIETTIFIILILIAIVVCIVLIVLKIIALFFEIPYIISKFIDKNKAKKTTTFLSQAIAHLIIGNKHQAAGIIKKFAVKLQPEHKELYNFINAEVEKDFEQQIQFFKELSLSKDYNYFACKRLAQVFHQHSLYQQSEKYATLALNSNEVDSDILEILIDCYANLGLWHKFVIIVSKFSRVNPVKLAVISNKIAQHYLTAAKHSLELGEDNEAVNYLEAALELYPTYIEALDLYFAININLHKTANQLIILKTAFAAEPSFAIAEIYIKFANIPASTIYNELAHHINHKQYWHLLVAIATYLNLPEQIQSLKKEKYLPM